MLRNHVGLILCAALLVAPGLVRAQATRTIAPASSPTSERQRLRSDLDRINAEIDALKRNNRGLGDDYRLRRRMADAEALARRLTEIDALYATTHRSRTATTDPASDWPQAPEANPSDDQVDLEAKADILADQARRLNNQADVLAERVTNLRRRQELRRRAGQLERDPFSPLEQARRRVSTGGPSSGTNGGKDTVAAPTSGAPASGRSTDSSVPTSTPGTQTPTTTTSVPSTGASAPSGVASTSASMPAGSTPALPAFPAGSNAAADTPGSVAMQFRGILDASTLAEIRRLEFPGSPTASLQAMERALNGLRARAAQLSANAASLRAAANLSR